MLVLYLQALCSLNVKIMKDHLNAMWQNVENSVVQSSCWTILLQNEGEGLQKREDSPNFRENDPSASMSLMC